MAPHPSSHPFRGQDHIDGGDGQPSPLGAGEMLVRVHACGDMSAAGTVIEVGDRVARFAVGDQVFGRFPADTWAWVEASCARITADGPHVERRPEGLGPLAAVALAQAGLTAKTILRAAELQPGQTALVIGATSRVGTELVALLADAGAHVIASATTDDDDYVRSLGAADTIECTTADQVADALEWHPDVDLLVDLVGFGEPYFLTAAASSGTMVTALPSPSGFGIPCIAISAEPGDLAALAERALDGRQARELAHDRPETVGQAPANHDLAVEPALALAG